MAAVGYTGILPQGMPSKMLPIPQVFYYATAHAFPVAFYDIRQTSFRTPGRHSCPGGWHSCASSCRTLPPTCGTARRRRALRPFSDPVRNRPSPVVVELVLKEKSKDRNSVGVLFIGETFHLLLNNCSLTRMFPPELFIRLSLRLFYKLCSECVVRAHLT